MSEFYTCSYCGRSFNSLHSKHCHENKCSKNPKSAKYANLTKTRVCERCGKEYTLECEDATERFCSRSCANTRQHSLETRNKISKSAVEYCRSHPDIFPSLVTSDKFCSVCGKKLCRYNKTGLCKAHAHLNPVSEETRLKLSKAGRRSAQVQKEARRSKIEALFFEEVSKIFSDAEANKLIIDGWDTDVFIPSLNLAIFWNGACHYYPIYGTASLNQTQNRDRIKEKMFNNMGIRVYVIKDINSEYPEDIRRSRRGKVLYQLDRLLLFVREEL